LNCADDDFRVHPIVAIFFEDDRIVVSSKQRSEGFLGLIPQPKAIRQE
jgi:hypothetical protein